MSSARRTGNTKRLGPRNWFLPYEEGRRGIGNLVLGPIGQWLITAMQDYTKPRVLESNQGTGEVYK